MGGKFRGEGEGKGVGKRGGEGKFRGARPPEMFFPRTAPDPNPFFKVTSFFDAEYLTNRYRCGHI